MNLSGSFLQTGGKNTITNTLSITDNGSYSFSGGDLQVSTLINNGKFDQSGGSLVANMTNNQLYTFTTGKFTGTLLNNGTVLFDVSKNETFNVDINGTGSLIKQNSGTIDLVGKNS